MSWPKQVIKRLKSPHLWVIVIILGFCTVPQYSEQLGISWRPSISLLFGFTRHTVERIFYLLPIIYAGLVLGPIAGIVVSLVSMALMLPRALFLSPAPLDVSSEIAMITLFGLISCLYLRAKKRWNEQKEKDRRFYIRQVVRAQEEERKRIARELHDDTAQVLTSLLRQLDTLARQKPHLSTVDMFVLENLKVELSRGLQGVHRLGQDLRPSLLDDLGLIPALRSVTKNLQQYDGIVTELKILGSERRFSPEVEIGVFRIVQEALINIRKHAQASEAQVMMEFTGDKTRVTISDNGRGFELSRQVDDLPRSGKLGLAGLQERAQLLGGTLEIHSAQGKGTTLIVEIPNQISVL